MNKKIHLIQGTLTNTIEHSGFASDLNIDDIRVFGLSSVSAVLINGESHADWTFDGNVRHSVHSPEPFLSLKNYIVITLDYVSSRNLSSPMPTFPSPALSR